AAVGMRGGKDFFSARANAEVGMEEKFLLGQRADFTGGDAVRFDGLEQLASPFGATGDQIQSLSARVRAECAPMREENVGSRVVARFFERVQSGFLNDGGILRREQLAECCEVVFRM